MASLRKFHSQDGLTLIEVMVSLLIVSISILAVYIMFINGIDFIREQEHKKVVAELAMNRLEACHYMYLKLDTIPRSYSGSYQDTVVRPSDEQEPIFANCEIVVTHSPIDINTGKAFYSEVSMVYEWRELSQQEHTLEFHAIF